MLASLIKKDYPTYVSSQENEFYNQGTNHFSTKESSETHITVANSNNFERAYQQYKKLYPHISDQEAQARVVFDFLKENGSNLSYEKNHNDFNAELPSESGSQIGIHLTRSSNWGGFVNTASFIFHYRRNGIDKIMIK